MEIIMGIFELGESKIKQVIFWVVILMILLGCVALAIKIGYAILAQQ
jgi:hypothetical protein